MLSIFSLNESTAFRPDVISATLNCAVSGKQMDNAMNWYLAIHFASESDGERHWWFIMWFAIESAMMSTDNTLSTMSQRPSLSSDDTIASSIAISTTDDAIRFTKSTKSRLTAFRTVFCAVNIYWIWIYCHSMKSIWIIPSFFSSHCKRCWSLIIPPHSPGAVFRHVWSWVTLWQFSSVFINLNLPTFSSFPQHSSVRHLSQLTQTSPTQCNTRSIGHHDNASVLEECRLPNCRKRKGNDLVQRGHQLPDAFHAFPITLYVHVRQHITRCFDPE